MQELHEAAGALETFATELSVDQPGHLLGTARMGADPQRSVVDSLGRSHDVPNLYIADGSISHQRRSESDLHDLCAGPADGRSIADNAAHQEEPA